VRQSEIIVECVVRFKLGRFAEMLQLQLLSRVHSSDPVTLEEH
jgi:hypothetical protein